MTHPREALIVARSAKVRAQEENPNVVVLAPGDPTMGHRFDRIRIATKLEGRDAEWRRTSLATRAVEGCLWTGGEVTVAIVVIDSAGEPPEADVADWLQGQVPEGETVYAATCPYADEIYNEVAWRYAWSEAALRGDLAGALADI